MTPEQHNRLENNWLPLMAMDPGDRDALKAAGGPWHLLSRGGCWLRLIDQDWHEGTVYRLAPQPKRKPVVQWQYISKNVVAVCQNINGSWWGHYEIPELNGFYGWDNKKKFVYIDENMVGPGLLIDPGDLTPDDWQDSLTIRPGYEEITT